MSFYLIPLARDDKPSCLPNRVRHYQPRPCGPAQLSQDASPGESNRDESSPVGTTETEPDDFSPTIWAGCHHSTARLSSINTQDNLHYLAIIELAHSFGIAG